MEINKYKEIIALTAVFPKTVHNFGLAYSWLGLIGETEETLKANLDLAKKEIGDVMWYTAAIANELKLDLEEIIKLVEEFEVNPERWYNQPSIAEYSEKIKKYYRDNQHIDGEEMVGVLASNILNLLQIWNLSSTDLSEIMEMNYNKLIARRATNTLHGNGDNREELVSK